MRRQLAVALGVFLLVLAWPGMLLAMGGGSIGNADARYTGEARSNGAGGSVATAGDVNGDGFDDLLIGASGNTAGGDLAGAAYLVLGSAKPVSDSLANAFRYTGTAANNRAGVSVAGAGDVNNDGFDDLLIGASGNEAGGRFAGAAYLVLGSAEPVSDSLANAIRYTGVLGDQAGNSVAGVGDVNGDGFDDLLVGAYLSEATVLGAGAAYLVLGSAAPVSDSLANAIRYTGEAGSDLAGISVAGAGDVNNDGLDDLLIGAPEHDTDISATGAAYLVLGSAQPVSDSLANAIRYTGEALEDRAGGAVAGAGDVNNDGFADLLIGAAGNVQSDNPAGKAYLVLGSAAPASDSLANATSYTGTEFAERAGGAVAGAGDVNGDGFADLLIGASGNTTNGENAGTVYLVPGSAAPVGDNLANAFRYTGEAEGDYAGIRVAGAGDINNDGLDDMLIGAPGVDVMPFNDEGAAYLVLGEPDPTALTLQ